MTDIKDDDYLEVAGLVGEFSWDFTRDFLVEQLKGCLTEQDFLNVVEGLVLSCGDKNKLISTRKEMGLKEHSKEDISKMDEWEE